MANLRESSSGFPGAFRLEVVVVLLVLVFGLTPPPSALAAGVWTPTGSLQTGRDYHTATRLADGKVLVAGGYTGSASLASGELYDPATGQWSPGGILAHARFRHTATLLTNGKVLVAGGFNDLEGALASAELYDPDLGAWFPAGTLKTSRRDHTATPLPNGQVLIAGGSNSIDGTLASAEVYDPATGQWSISSSLQTGRMIHTGTLLASGQVLVAGGLDGNSNYLSSAVLFLKILTAYLWTSTGDLVHARYNHSATLLRNGKVLVAGGHGVISGDFIDTAELYNPAFGSWAAFPGPKRIHHTATLLVSGKVLMAGGMGPGISHSSTLVYDPGTGAWLPTGSLNFGRITHTATLLTDGRVLVAGGVDGSTIRTSAELYREALTAPASLLLLLDH
jgi:large repetitive protein